MFDKLKKYTNKVLVFALNFLLMAIIVLAIKEKDRARISEKKQNDLLIDNSSLSDENAALKDELQSFKGTIESNDPVSAGEGKNIQAVESSPVVTNNPISDNTVQRSLGSSNASNGTINNNSNSSASNSSVSPSPAKTPPSSNSKTKTS